MFHLKITYIENIIANYLLLINNRLVSIKTIILHIQCIQSVDQHSKLSDCNLYNVLLIATKNKQKQITNLRAISEIFRFNLNGDVTKS